MQTIGYSQETNNQIISLGINKLNPLPQPNSPIIDGYYYWFLRANRANDISQTIIQYLHNFDTNYQNKNEYLRFEVTESVIEKGKFKALFSLRYKNTPISSKNKLLDESLKHLWLFTVWEYGFSSKWNLMLSSEFYQRGNKNTFEKNVGNQLSFISYLTYNVNSNWQLILLNVYENTYKENETKKRYIPLLQARWQPNKNFKMLFGLPGIMGIEWLIDSKVDIIANTFINTDTDIALSYKLNNKLNLSLQYHRSDNESGNYYFAKRKLSLPNDKVVFYDRITQFENKISLNLGINTLEHSALIISIGYLQNNNELFLNDNSALKLNVYNQFFIGMNFVSNKM